MSARRGLSAAILLVVAALVSGAPAEARPLLTTNTRSSEPSPVRSTDPTDQLLSARANGYLTGPQPGDPLDLALAYSLTDGVSRGQTIADLTDPIVTDQYTDADTGVTHVYLAQQVGGIPVRGANVNVNVAADGSIISIGNSFESDAASRVDAAVPARSARSAVADAAAAVDLSLQARPKVRDVASSPTRETNFDSASGTTSEPIQASLAYVPSGKALHLAWEVDLAPASGEHWWNVAVSATTGAELDTFDYVDHETSSYDVFPAAARSPYDGPRQTVASPADPLASPFGWNDTDGVAGAEDTHTIGNNVHAATDLDADNNPDAGSEPDGGSGLLFDLPLDLAQPPSAYRPFSVANLYYLNNSIHDVLYRYGFTEQSGNFQVNNYGKGGLGDDAVLAESQDGSGTNNANMATPPDGSRPRMQMYTWTGPSHLDIAGPSSAAGSYGFAVAAGSAPISETPLTQSLELANDGVATFSDGCSSFVGFTVGRIALVDRGTCNFQIKAQNAAAAGASGLIIGNNAVGLVTPNLNQNFTFPVISITLADRNTIVAGLPATASIYKDVDVDSSLDAEVVYHEYTHGLSNRLTGGPSNTRCLANIEQMGEGWSDFVALALTQPDSTTVKRGMGNYAAGLAIDGGGIRSYPYTTDMGINPTTYNTIKSVSGPHAIGHVWATMLWDLYWKFVDLHGFNADITGALSSGGNNLALQLVIDGMKLQPCSPGFVDARNAILAADQVRTGGENQCAIWEVFARRGLGFSASQGSSAVQTDGVQAFDVPSCPTAGSAPSNDAFASPVQLVAGRGTVVDDNVFATTELDEPSTVGAVSTGTSIWYDLVPRWSGTLQIDTCESEAPIAVSVYSGSQVNALEEIGSTEDCASSGPNTVVVPVAKLSNYRVRVGGTDGAQGQFTLRWDIVPQHVAVGDVTLVECACNQSQAQVPVRLDSVAQGDVTVSYTTEAQTATAGADYTETSGTLVISSGSQSGVILVPVNGDSKVESSETLSVSLSNPSGALLGRASGTVTILDQDALPVANIGRASVMEGFSGSTPVTLDVTLDRPSTSPVSFGWSTVAGTAGSSDFTAASGTVTIPAGATSRSITVAVKGDSVKEKTERFTIKLKNPSGITISDGTGEIDVLDDDTSPAPASAISIGDVSLSEGNSADHPASLTIRLNKAAATDVSVLYATVAGSAAEGSDFAAASKRVTIRAGKLAVVVPITVRKDVARESNEKFTVKLSAPKGGATLGRATGTVTVVDDDTSRISIGSTAMVEGRTGSATSQVSVVLSRPSTATVTAKVSTGTGSAGPGDFSALTDVPISFSPGTVSISLPVGVLGDGAPEATETFPLNLSAVTNATIARGSSTMKILDDDSVPGLSWTTAAGVGDPQGMALGPDGAIWFTDFNNDSIGRVTLGSSPTVTVYKDKSMADPYRIAAGPDGAMWFTNLSGASVGRITTDGSATVSSVTFGGNSQPVAIVQGPDGAMWVTEIAGAIRRVSTDGSNSVSTFSLPGASSLLDIAAGSDAVWIAEYSSNRIGRVAMDGSYTTLSDSEMTGPIALDVASDGSLWVADYDTASFTHVTFEGGTTFSTTQPLAVEGPQAVALSGSELWFASDDGTIGSLQTSPEPAVTTRSVQVHQVRPYGVGDVLVGPDGAVWFTDPGNRAIGRFED